MMELTELEEMILDFCSFGRTMEEVVEQFPNCKNVDETLGRLESHGYIECMWDDMDDEEEETEPLWYTV